MITWEFAKDRYGVSEFWLETLSATNPNLCDNNNCMVYNFWAARK